MEFMINLIESHKKRICPFCSKMLFHIIALYVYINFQNFDLNLFPITVYLLLE